MVKDRPLEFFTSMIRDEMPFTFSRWGDGEWHSVLGRTAGRNCDGHYFFPMLGQDLKALLKSKPRYMLGMQPLAMRILGERINNFLEPYQLQNLDWVNADVFHKASEAGNLIELITVLKNRHLLVVGPPHLSSLQEFLGFSKFVTVPPRDSYLARKEIIKDCLSALEGMPKSTLVSVSAGMPAKLIIHELHSRRAAHTIIDFGSVWDIYAGVKSRKYMRNMTVRGGNNVDGTG